MALDKRYDFNKVEENRYNIWKEKGYFKAGDKSKPKFLVVLPPPNVTGILHIGHSIDTTIQDITCRYKKAKGFDVLYLPGCDHAGIATQAKVDAKLKSEGISRFDIGREEFLKRAFEWKEEHSDIIHAQWAKMGLMLDYSRERFTLDEGFQKAVYKVFKDLYDKGIIYRGERIVNYDPVMRTALSNIEVIYKEDDGFFYHFKYRFADDKDKYLEIATTRPETMFGDTCICVNPNDEKYKDVVGKMVINPANDEIIPVIADDYVEIGFGTGAMKCTPAHDPNDFIIGQKYHQKFHLIMNVDGTMNELCGKYAHMDRYACREALLKDIEARGDLIKIVPYKHQVGHSERSDAVVEPILSKQWFIKMKPFSEMILANQKSKDKVKFFPSRFEKVLTRWMENVDDWCISRQLWWGHRIPVYYNKNDGSFVVSDHIPNDQENWYQDEDVLDTWFSSALWTFATLGWPDDTEDLKRYFPVDVMVTGYDIIFFWVSRMYFQGMEFMHQKPFNDVLIHGLVRDKLGRKMSKSLGNGVDPVDVIAKYGVDSLRYFLATVSTPGQDMRYDEEKVASSNNYLNKIWNSARFILMNLPDNYEYKNVKTSELNKVDKDILTKLETTIKNVTKYMDKYEYGMASTFLYNFVYDDFCSTYIEFAKLVLNNPEAKKDGTYYTLVTVLKAVIMMIYPFSPFISEEIYLNIPGAKESIMLEDYPKFTKKLVFNEESNEVNILRSAIEKVRAYKVNNKLAPNAKVNLKVIGNGISDELLPYLARFSFASELTRVNAEIKNASVIVLSDFTIYIVDDVNKEELKKNLLTQKEKLESEIKRSEGMLNNPNFLAKAPKQKIDAEKEKYENYKAQLAEVNSKLN